MVLLYLACDHQNLSHTYRPVRSRRTIWRKQQRQVTQQLNSSEFIFEISVRDLVFGLS